MPDIPSVATPHGVVAGYEPGWSVVNLRGAPQDPAFTQAVSRVLGGPLPVQPGGTLQGDALTVVWAGPDDWFVLSRAHEGPALCQALRAPLAGLHHAVTDVSGGYRLLNLAGPRVRELLAQGCPLDLHPRCFGPGQAAGTVFFKASVWLWQATPESAYRLLVRSSFSGYVWHMVEAASAGLGLVKRVFR